MVERNPVVFVHGYSDKGASWAPWRAILAARLGFADEDMRTCTYVTLNNDVTIKDIAEAFDRALGVQGGLSPGQAFDVVVHSTGMLVVRTWLAADPRRAGRVKRLIAFAPATFGSPLAKNGRSWLGALFKGDKTPFSPDFLQAGDLVLDALELGSSFTWQLAEADLVAEPPRYSAGAETPFVFVFCGRGAYEGIKQLVDRPGTDGTVRRAGCGMNVRLIGLDLTARGHFAVLARPELADKAELAPAERILAGPWLGVDIPVHLVGDATNHASILSDPPAELVELVVRAFEMTASGEGRDPAAGYADWLQLADAPGLMAGMKAQYAQFVVHAVDQRGDPVTDYNLQLYLVAPDGDGDGVRVEAFDETVDVYSSDGSYRCFHVDLDSLLPGNTGISIRVVAASGTALVGYLGYGFERQLEPGSWDAQLTLDAATVAAHGVFRPYTTTLVRLYIERQVLPPDLSAPSPLLAWDVPDGAVRVV